MKKFWLSFFLVFLYAATVSAASSGISRTIPTKNDTESATEERTISPSSSTTNRATVSRNVTRKTQGTTNKTANTISRSVNNRKKSSAASFSEAVNTVGRSARTEAASINNNPAVRRAGLTLRASTAEVGGRATIGNSDVQTGSNIDEQVRGVKSRAGIFGTKKTNVTAESLAAAKEMMEKTADLNNTCQQQYNECMDQFCAVVDNNQKRCSCSSNLQKYTNAQQAVEDANAELNEVAQQIRYVGLSADEISAIMSATEAELEMTKTKDHTKNRNLLDDIAEMIKDPTAYTDLYGSSVDSLLDLDFDFTSDSNDLFSLDLFGTTNDISSKRGTALYNEARKRCKTVLSRCKDAGGTENQISGNYDLLIAKDCASYESGLEKLNTTLKNNVRSANLMLQKARLAVLQNKNEYDARECIGALETCMLDDMVCGEDYVKCVDPTKVYIDENGEVVLGRNIAAITELMSTYDNTKITSDFIKSAVSDTKCTKTDGSCIVNYLMTKVGTGQSFKEGGLCRPVLDKCQYYTYEKNGKNSTYLPYNEVVVNYIQRALVNIKAAQTKVISNYASTCLNEVGDCYNQQNTQVTSWSSVATIDNIYRVMKGTCYNVALTCGYAVLAYDIEAGQKVHKVVTDYYQTAQPTPIMSNHRTDADPDWRMDRNPTADEKKEIDALQKDALINMISDMFYQSLLCPDHSSFSDVTKTVAIEKDYTYQDSYVNERCRCDADYYVNGSSCVSICPDGTFGHGGTSLYGGTCKTIKPDDCLLVHDNICVTECPTAYRYQLPVQNAGYNKCVIECPTEHPNPDSENVCGD